MYSEEQNSAVGKDSYPNGDKNHAKAAISRINQAQLSSEQKMAVIRKANQMLKK